MRRSNTSQLLQKASSQLRGEANPNPTTAEEDEDRAIGSYLSSLNRKTTKPNAEIDWGNIENLEFDQDDKEKTASTFENSNKFLKKKNKPDYSESAKVTQQKTIKTLPAAERGPAVLKRVDNIAKKIITAKPKDILGLSDSDFDMDFDNISMSESRISVSESKKSSDSEFGKAGRRFLKKPPPTKLPSDEQQLKPNSVISEKNMEKSPEKSPLTPRTPRSGRTPTMDDISEERALESIETEDESYKMNIMDVGELSAIDDESPLPMRMQLQSIDDLEEVTQRPKSPPPHKGILVTSPRPAITPRSSRSRVQISLDEVTVVRSRSPSPQPVSSARASESIAYSEDFEETETAKTIPDAPSASESIRTDIGDKKARIARQISEEVTYSEDFDETSAADSLSQDDEDIEANRLPRRYSRRFSAVFSGILNPEDLNRLQAIAQSQQYLKSDPSSCSGESVSQSQTISSKSQQAGDQYASNARSPSPTESLSSSSYTDSSSSSSTLRSHSTQHRSPQSSPEPRRREKTAKERRPRSKTVGLQTDENIRLTTSVLHDWSANKACGPAPEIPPMPTETFTPTHSINPESLAALTSYNPNSLVLNEMLKAQVELTRQFVENQIRTVDMFRNAVELDFQYTTLKDTRKYIRKHKKNPISYKKALKDVKREMGLT